MCVCYFRLQRTEFEVAGDVILVTFVLQLSFFCLETKRKNKSKAFFLPTRFLPLR